MKQKRFTALLSVCLVLIALNIPFETVSVPEWKIKVTNQDGVPLKDVLIRQHWNNYSLDFSAVDVKEDDRVTDRNGIVIFPERRDRASGAHRLMALFYDLAKLAIVHSSSGIHATVLSPDYADTTVSYDGSGTPPNQLIVPD